VRNLWQDSIGAALLILIELRSALQCRKSSHRHHYSSSTAVCKAVVGRQSRSLVAGSRRGELLQSSDSSGLLLGTGRFTLRPSHWSRRRLPPFRRVQTPFIGTSDSLTTSVVWQRRASVVLVATTWRLKFEPGTGPMLSTDFATG
jgi:hypothetical protein